MEQPSENLFDSVSKDVLLHMFKFFKRSNILSVRLTSKRFNMLFKDEALLSFVKNNNSKDLREMNYSELQSALHSRRHDAEFILVVVREKFCSGQISYSMIRTFISSISTELFFRFGKFFDFKNHSAQTEFDFFDNLCSSVVCSPGYYTGEVESGNSLFMSLVSSLQRIDLSNLGLNPKNKERSIILFQYAVLSLPEESTVAEPLREIFEEYFFEKNRTLARLTI